jgi:trimethylamine--corrinoid protein Co-methyltransferase
MLDFLACQSPEKLVVDAEAIGMAKRLIEGVQLRTGTLATELFEGIEFKADFLKQKITRKLFRQEQYLPSEVIDRGSIRAWQDSGRLDTFARAKTRTSELLAAYQPPVLPAEQEAELHSMVVRLAKGAGMDRLPELE